eukprot:5421698-Amphidinium_carterae.1
MSIYYLYLRMWSTGMLHSCFQPALLQSPECTCSGIGERNEGTKCHDRPRCETVLTIHALASISISI